MQRGAERSASCWSPSRACCTGSPDSVTFDEAAFAEPFCGARNALVERCPVTPGDIAVIQRVGAIGSLALQIAGLQGAGTRVILGTAVDGHRLALASAAGADHVLDVMGR